MIIKLFLGTAQHISDIIGVAAIMITIILAPISDTCEKSNMKCRRIIWTVVVCFTSIALIIVSTIFSNRYSVVPDVYGLSFNSALEKFNNAELKGTILLSEANLEKVSSDNKVVWQSKLAGDVATQGDTVYLVVDNCFGYEYNPIKKPLGIIDTKEWSWNRNHSHVEIKLPIRYDLNRRINSSAIAIDVYSEKLACTLQEVLTEYSYDERDISGALRFNGDAFQLIGKLTTKNSEKSEYGMKCVEVDDGLYKSSFLMPAVLYNEEYILYFSFFDENENHFDGYLSVSFYEEHEQDNS